MQIGLEKGADGPFDDKLAVVEKRSIEQHKQPAVVELVRSDCVNQRLDAWQRRFNDVHGRFLEQFNAKKEIVPMSRVRVVQVHIDWCLLIGPCVRFEIVRSDARFAHLGQICGPLEQIERSFATKRVGVRQGRLDDLPIFGFAHKRALNVISLANTIGQ